MVGDPTIVGISWKTLYLAPGERADVVVDFSQVPKGSKLILYNDAPAPAPIGDSRVDYYTGDPDLTVIGRRAEHARRLRTQHAHDHAVPGRRPRLPALRPRAAADARCRPPSPPPRTPSSSPRPPTTPSTMPLAGPPTQSPPPTSCSTRPGTLTFTPLGRGYRLTLPVQGKMVSRAVRPRVRPQDGHAGRGRAALGQRRADLGAVLGHRPRDGVRGGRRRGVPATGRRRDADMAHHARRHRVAQHPLRRLQRPGAGARHARRRGARARRRRARLEGHAAGRPAGVRPHRLATRARAGAVRAASPAGGRST